MTTVMRFRQQNPTPPADDGDDAELSLHAHNQFQIALIGLNRLLHSAALDALLDDYLQRHPRPRPDEDAPLDAPELD